MPRIRLPRIQGPIRFPFNIRRLSTAHVLVIAYATLLLGFIIVVLAVWNEG
ncbi:MAG: hypothetical protein ABI432_18580 [Flavobacteriales bacterium]